MNYLLRESVAYPVLIIAGTPLTPKNSAGVRARMGVSKGCSKIFRVSVLIKGKFQTRWRMVIIVVNYDILSDCLKTIYHS